MRKFRKYKQFGIGLLELMLSLSIIAILLVMATRYYLVTSYSRKLNQVTSEMAQIQGAAYSWKGTKADYTGISGPNLVDAGLIASGDIGKDKENIVTPWEVIIHVESTTIGENKPGVTVYFTGSTTGGEEEKACYALVNKFNNLNNDLDVTATCDGQKFTFTFY